MAPDKRRRGPAWEPFAQRLTRELSELLSGIDALLDISSIRNIDPNRTSHGIAFLGWPIWGWSPSDDAQTAMRLELLERFRRWRELFNLLFRDPPQDLKKPIDSGLQLIDDWLNRPTGDHSVPSSIAEAHSRLQERTAGLLDALALRSSGVSGLVAIPDTNSLLAEPDVARYADTIGSREYEVRLLSTVIGELDRLKFEGRTPELRDRVKAVIRRIKGLRDKGSLNAGVNLTKTIRVVSVAREPDFSRLPGWLDPSLADDRILASALELQGDTPAGTVVLVTADLNLQTKADAAGMPYVEPPGDEGSPSESSV